jgi:hypothetical protein
MLNPLDNSLFLDKINLVKIPHGWVYPIFKNGSSTIFNYCKKNNDFYIVSIKEFYELNEITVFIRSPIERYKSGLQTVVHNLIRDYEFLDQETVSFMLQKYLFLDVHFLPQFHWLLNLSRFIGADVPITFRHVEDINSIFLNNNSCIPDKNKNISINEDNFSNLYLQLDEIIFNFIGSTLTFNELLNFIKKDKDAKFDEIFYATKSLMEILD